MAQEVLCHVRFFCFSASHDLLSYSHIPDTGCLVLVRWNVTVYHNVTTLLAVQLSVRLLRLVVNIINDCCCSIQNYNAAIWWTTVAKLGSSFEPPEPPLAMGLFIVCI